MFMNESANEFTIKMNILSKDKLTKIFSLMFTKILHNVLSNDVGRMNIIIKRKISLKDIDPKEDNIIVVDKLSNAHITMKKMTQTIISLPSKRFEVRHPLPIKIFGIRKIDYLKGVHIKPLVMNNSIIVSFKYNESLVILANFKAFINPIYEGYISVFNTLATIKNYLDNKGENYEIIRIHLDDYPCTYHRMINNLGCALHKNYYYKLSSILHSYSDIISCSIGVVPVFPHFSHCSVDYVAWSKDIMNLLIRSDSWDIILHGLTHVNDWEYLARYILSRKEVYKRAPHFLKLYMLEREFYDEVTSREAPKSEIESRLKIALETLGFHCKKFVAPGHAYGPNTLNVLDEMDFKRIYINSLCLFKHPLPKISIPLRFINFQQYRVKPVIRIAPLYEGLIPLYIEFSRLNYRPLIIEGHILNLEKLELILKTLSKLIKYYFKAHKNA